MNYTKVVEEDINQIIEDINIEKFEKFRNKTFLITGSTGMIGSYFVLTLMKLNELFNMNIKILAGVRDINKVPEYWQNNDNIKIIINDVVNPFDIQDEVNYIIHAASPASPKIMSIKPLETNFANTRGTANTIKLALEKHSDGYLFVSSREIYGQANPNQEYFTEDGKLGEINHLVPRNGYAEGKKAAENMCASALEEYELNVKVVRLAHTYGPGMSIYDGRVQADFLNNIIHNENIVLKSDGSSERTYTYISDAIRAMFMILIDSKEMLYNVASEEKITIKELAETLVNMDKKKKLKLVFDIPQTQNKGTASFTLGILSSKKLRDELGWIPYYNVEEGFKRTIEHLEEEFKLTKAHIKKLK